MKHLKTYEGSTDEPKYKLFDYVLLDKDDIIKDDSFYDEKELNIYKNYGKIMSKSFIGQVDRKEERMYDVYYLCADDFTLKEITSMYLMEDYMIRTLTPEEIEEFEYIISSNKYNL